MANDERPDNDAKLKRRGRAPVITLEATEVTPPGTASADVAETAANAAAVETTEAAAVPEPVTEAVVDAPAAARTETPAGPTAMPAEARVGQHAEPPSEPAPEPSPEASPKAIPEPPPVASRPEPAPPQAQSGFGRLAAAGLIGALVTGGLGYAGSLAGLLPGADRAAVASLERRVADLDRAVRETSARIQPAPDLAPLARRVEAVDTARAALESRLAAVEGRPADSAAGAATAGTSVDLAPLTRDVEALKAALATVVAAQSRGEPGPATAAPTVDLAAVDSRIQSLLAPQAGRIGDVEARVQNLGTEVKTAVEATQTLATRITALDGARAQANGAGQRAALLVGIEMLRSAVDRGTPYATELRALKALGANAAGLQPLEASSERGLTPTALLARRFTDMAATLVKAAPRPTDGSLFDRLAANAQSLIRIRPVGEAAGDDTPIVVGRIEAKLNRGDLSGALADFDRLPEAAKVVAKDWERDARARLASEAALKRMADEAIGALATR